MENNENTEYNEDMDYTEDTRYSEGRNPRNNKKKIIAGVIAALVVIGLIAGFFYLNNKQNSEKTALLDSIKKNVLTEDNANYLKNQKFTDQTQLDKLTSIVEKAKDGNIGLDDLKNLSKDQLGILDPINKKLEGKDGQITKALNYFIGLVPGLSGAASKLINIDQIKKIAGEKFDLNKIVNENIPFIKNKNSTLSTLKKVAFDKNALLKGDFSSIAGTYVNSKGESFTINKNGSVITKDFNANGCKGSKAKLNKLGYYTWGIGCKVGSGGAAAFFPIGVEVKIPMDSGADMTVASDTTKNRMSWGQSMGGKPENYYARK